MEFNFVVGRHSISNDSEKVIGGFLNIEKAKDYATIKELDYLSNGYMYIDAPEGRYVLGADRKTEMNKWYAPNEITYVYDSSKDRAVNIEDTKQWVCKIEK